MEPRATCPRCRRPTRVCYCAALRPADSRTRVVFLQHPREARVPVSTCRMAHLSLPNSELHVGLRAEGDARLEALCREPGTWVLFPSPAAVPLEQLPEPPRTLVVVDGTWDNAKKVVERSPLLAALPRVGFRPERPGNYRIRREPAEHCLSTIEAVAHVLGRLEGDGPRFGAMLSAFDAMVEKQLGFIGAREGPSRYKLPRVRHTGRPGPREQLERAWPDLVVAHGEANAWPRGLGQTGPGELLQLVAQRPSTGEAFESLLVPRRPLGPHVPLHLDLPADVILRGRPVPEALAAWRAFVGSSTLLVWGDFTPGLLAAEGAAPAAVLDLRRLVARLRGSSAGAVEDVALALGATLPSGRGRGARRLEAMVHVARAIRAGEGPARVRRRGAAAPALRQAVG